MDGPSRPQAARPISVAISPLRSQTATRRRTPTPRPTRPTPSPSPRPPASFTPRLDRDRGDAFRAGARKRTFEVRRLQARGPVGDTLPIALRCFLLSSQHNGRTDSDELEPAFPGAVRARPAAHARHVGCAIDRVAQMLREFKDLNRRTGW